MNRFLSSAALGRRDLLAGLLAGGATTAIALRGGPLRAATGAGINALDALPAAFQAAIRAGTAAADLAAHLDQAARRAAAQGVPLHFPAGTYTMQTWSPPAGLTVTTEGRGTVFRQLPTRGRPQRFIQVTSDGVRLWPGGSATIDGGMTARGDNATAFNSGIYVYAGPGRRIARFECGDIYGRNLGGDVFETGCDARGFLGTCTVGSLYGDNIYRNLLSITGGMAGSVAAVVQTGGVGFATLCIEPDPTSAPVGDWTIGSVVGHRVAVAGDPAARVGTTTIRELDLDDRRPTSRPAFSAGGVSRAATPTAFEVGLRYRNLAALRIDRATIANFAHAAIEDIGLLPRDAVSGTVSIGSLTIRHCGRPNGYQVVTQKTRAFEIGELTAIEKASPLVATFIGGFAMTAIRVDRGAVAGRVVLASKGSFEANGLALRGSADRAFYNVEGPLRLSGLSGAGPSVLFDNCTGPIEVGSSDVQAGQIARGSAVPRFRASRVNGRSVN